MTQHANEAVQWVAYFGLMLGLIGTVAPIIPGPALVWLSALLWAWADGFERVGWPTLILMLVLAVLATLADLLLSAYGGRKTGASWISLLVAGIAAVAGFVVFNLPGAILGAAGGILLSEWRRNDRDWQLAWQSGKGLLIGWLASFFAQFALVLLMLLVFTVQAFGPE